MIHTIATYGIGNAWVAAELHVMKKKGIPVVLHSQRRPHQNFFGSEWAREMNARTRFLYPLPWLGVALSVLLAPVLFGGRFFAALANALFSPRENLRNRVASITHVFVAAHWARGLRREEVSHIHAQWADSGATIGMYGAWLLGVPFSFTGHAADLFKQRVALADKVRRAEFIVCISRFHKEFYKQFGAREEQLVLVPCGIDPAEFAFRPRTRGRAGELGSRGRTILSVGRVVEKKGFHDLISACRILKDRGVSHQCVIAGSGPLARQLLQQVSQLGLDEHVTVTGQAVLQEDLPEMMRACDVFAQPCVWSKDNDVDGTPRTLMEAMASGAPVVATRIAGLPDIVADGRAGLLVEPGDVTALADALQRLLEDDGLAERLSLAGRRHIEDEFDIDACLDVLAERYRRRLGGVRTNKVTGSTRAVSRATTREEIPA